MNTEPQFIRNKDGDPAYIVLPVAEYEALFNELEEARDIIALRTVQAARASGEEEDVPGEVVDRLLDGENPVRVWREHRGLSQTKLAEAAGLTQSYLSQIETGGREGTIETMAHIARALEVDLDDLVPAAKD